MDEALRRLEENEGYQEIVENMSEGSEGEVEQKVQNCLACIQKVSWMNKEQFEHLEGGVRQAVEARRKGSGKEQEHRRQGEQVQHRTGAQQARQARVGRATSGKRTRAGGDGQNERGTDRPRKWRPRSRVR